MRITLTLKYKKLQKEHNTLLVVAYEQSKIIEQLRIKNDRLIRDNFEKKLILESIFRDDFVL